MSLADWLVLRNNVETLAHGETSSQKRTLEKKMTSNLLSVRPEMYVVVLYVVVTHHSIVCSCNPYYSKYLNKCEEVSKNYFKTGIILFKS